MQRIGELANQALQNKPQEHASSMKEPQRPKYPPASTKLMSNLWERMTHLFGYSWTTINGVSATGEDGNLSEVARTWSIGLSGATGEEIAQGLKGCIELGEKWPPGLPQFVKMCQKAEKPVYYQRLPAPPRTDEQKDRVRNILQEAKEMLR